MIINSLMIINNLMTNLFIQFIKI